MDYEIKRDESGNIVEVVHRVLCVPAKIYTIGGAVQSSGRIYLPRGHAGKIVAFREPWKGCTDDFIDVLFEGKEFSTFMKPKDLL